VTYIVGPGLLSAVILVLSASAVPAFAQSPPTRTFEVAAITPSVPLQTQISTGQLRVGSTITDSRIDMRSASLADLVTLAYTLKPYQLTAPDWMRSERYDVQATYPPGATKDQAPEMMQALLADRFKLRIRHDKKKQPVYALVLAGDGLKVKPSAPPAAEPAEPEPGSRTLERAGQKIQIGGDNRSVSIAGPEGQTIRISQVDGVMALQLGRISMPALAEMLTSFVDKPVIDATAVTGIYDVPLEMKMEDMLAMAQVAARSAGIVLPGAAGAGVTGQASDPGNASIFQSVQKLGLRLDSRTMPVAIIVVESAERTPTEN
jgi:uncharacterized protein (TIGR03435 family)